MDLSPERLKDSMARNSTIYQVAADLTVSRNTVEKYIRLFGLTKPERFYSRGLKIGRPGGFKHTPEFLEMMKVRMSGEGNAFYGKHHSEATRAKMSANHADVAGDRNPFRRSMNDPVKKEAHIQRCLELWKARGPEYRKNFGSKKISGGYREIAQHWWNHISRGAIKRGIEVSVSLEYLWFVLEEIQNFRCSMTGVPLEIHRSPEYETTGSVDRIDSSLGYVEGNIQWIHKYINRMKWDTPQDVFIDWCRRIVDHADSLDRSGTVKLSSKVPSRIKSLVQN